MRTAGSSPANASQTNVVQNLSVHLRGMQPGGPVTNRTTVTTGFAPVIIENRQIVQALGAALGSTFGNLARLVVVTPLGGGESAVQVRDASQQVDVTWFFRHEQVSEAVSGSSTTLFNRRTVYQDFSIQRFALRNGEGSSALGLHFDLRGMASERTGANGVSGLSLDCSGSGDLNGNLLILRGNIEVQGDRQEVVVVNNEPS